MPMKEQACALFRETVLWELSLVVFLLTVSNKLSFLTVWLPSVHHEMNSLHLVTWYNTEVVKGPKSIYSLMTY